MVSSLIYILTRVLFITHFTPLSPWRGVGGEAVEGARGVRLESLSCINYSVFFLLPGIYCRSSSR